MLQQGDIIVLMWPPLGQVPGVPKKGEPNSELCKHFRADENFL